MSRLRVAHLPEFHAKFLRNFPLTGAKVRNPILPCSARNSGRGLSRPSPSTVGPLRQLRQLRQQVNEKREDEKTRSGCRLPPFPPADSIRVPRGPNEGWLTTRPKAVGERARAAGAACAAGEDRECDAPTTGGTIPALACTATCARASARGARRARTRERRHPQRQGRERERRHHTC